VANMHLSAPGKRRPLILVMERVTRRTKRSRWTSLSRKILSMWTEQAPSQSLVDPEKTISGARATLDFGGDMDLGCG